MSSLFTSEIIVLHIKSICGNERTYKCKKFSIFFTRKKEVDSILIFKINK